MTPEQQTPASVVERLRRTSRNTCGMETDTLVNPDGHEAAAWIERLSAEREGLREALETIARRVVPDHYDDKALIGWISAGEIRAARAALTLGESRQSEVSLIALSAEANFYPEDTPQGFIEWTFVLPRTVEVGAGLYELRHIRCLTVAERDDPYAVLSPAAPTPADGGGE